MSNGSYFGGSTILYPGSDWFSGERLKRANLPGKKRNTSSAKKKTNDPKPKVQAKPSQAERLPQIRRDFIKAVLSADRRGIPVPGIPKVLRAELGELVNDGSALAAWARKRPEAASIIESLEPVPPMPTLPVGSTPIEQARWNYLVQVVAAMMAPAPIPSVPRKSSELLIAEISKIADVSAWARSHPSYEVLASRALAKKRRNLPASITKASTRSVPNIPPAKPIKQGKRPMFGAADALTVKLNVLAELERTHPGNSIRVIAEAETKAMSILQLDAKKRFRTSGLPNLESFPAYLVVFKEVRSELRRRRE